jgi:hypothetical protein
MDIAEMAARHVQAAFPRSRGGSASPSFRTALSVEEPGIGKVEVTPICASLSDNWRVPGAIVAVRPEIGRTGFLKG